MQRSRRRYLASIGLLAALAISGTNVGAEKGAQIVTGVFCDTQDQMEGFAEAHIGAQLSVAEAMRAINKAMGKDDACAPIANVVVGNMENVKEMTIAGSGYAVTRLSVIGIMTPTPSGMAPQLVPAVEQYVLTRSKGVNI